MLARGHFLRFGALVGLAGIVVLDLLMPRSGVGQPPTAHAASVLGWQYKGFTLAPYGQNSLNNSAAALQQLAAAGANSVTIVVTAYTPSTSSTDIISTANTASDSSIIYAIQQARSLGLKVILKPHIDSQDGAWRAYINPTDYQTWFTNYGQWIDHYADIAQQQGVSVLVVGSELIDMSTNASYAPYWRQIVAGVRQHFSGLLTYSANWGGSDWTSEYAHISWWDALDYLGISAYYDLADGPDPSVSTILSHWQAYLSGQILPFEQQWNKPLLFTEGGYRNIADAAAYPWDYSTTGPPDNQEQVNAYRALFQFWASSYSWFVGEEFWDWSINTNVDPNSTGYEVQNKPAMQVVTSWFSAGNPTSTPTSTAVPSPTNTPSPTATPTPSGPALGASYSVSGLSSTATAGSATTFQLTVTNTGSTTWQTGGSTPMHIGVHFASQGGGYGVSGNDSTWLTNQRFALPSAVAPGQSVTVSVTANVPAVTGNLVLEVEMVQENVAWFPQYLDQSVAVVGAVQLAASYAVTGQPSHFAAGESRTYSITLTNTGSQTWTASGSTPVHLGVHFAARGGGYGQSGIDSSWMTNQRVALPASVAPGSSVTLNLNVQAPTSSGRYVVEYELVQENVAWFSSYLDSSVDVGTASSQALGAMYQVQATNASVAHGATRTYTITVTNTGTSTWATSGSTPVHLGAHFATRGGGYGVSGTDSTWLTNQRFALPASVAPGQTVTFSVQVATPAGAGNDVLEWELVQENVAWFPDFLDLGVQVT